MALVGCGPAYVFHFMDALAEAGVTMGFTRQEALELVTQLVLGSAKLGGTAGEPSRHPARTGVLTGGRDHRGGQPPRSHRRARPPH